LVLDKDKILGIAQKYILKGQTKKAITEYLKLIQASPKDKRLHLKLGDLYMKIGEDEKAIQEYLKLADLYTEEELNSRAISVYKKILSISPKLVEAFRRIASLYLKEGLVGSAKSYYRNILEIQPGDQEALRALEDIEAFRQPKEVLPAISHEEPHGIKDRHIGKRPPEEKVPPTLMSKIPPPISMPGGEPPPPEKESETHYHLGIAYKEMDLYDYAISEFELAASNPSMKFDCYIMLGSCYMEKGDYNKSIQSYKAAAQIKGLPDEKSARLQYHLGLAYEANGMNSDALGAFNLVLKLDPSFSGIEEKVKKLRHSQK